MASKLAVRGEHFSQKYGSRWVFRDLDISIPTGVTGLLGPNGVGKTTLMRSVCALFKPAGGSLHVLDLDVSSPRDRQRLRAKIGYLPQTFGYYPHFTVCEFITYSAWLKRVPRSKVKQYVDEAIECVALTGRADEKMKSLSGGMLRRAGIAHAIVHKPALLILDEPTVGLDPHQRIELRSLIRSIGVDGSVLISTHLVEDVRTMCSTVQVLAPGKLVFSGSPEELASTAAPGALGDNDLECGYVTVLGSAGVAQ